MTRGFLTFFVVLLPCFALAQVAKPIIPPVAQAPLEAPLLDSIGLSAKEGALPASIWQASNPQEIATLLERVVLLPLPKEAQLLLKRLAISPAALPGKPEGVWLARRLQLLRDIGEEKAFAELLQRVPTANRLQVIERLEVEQLLLASNAAKACEKVAQAIEKYPDSFWVKANAFCLARQKKTAEAELALQVWREKAKAEEAGAAAFPYEDGVRKILGESPKFTPLASYALSPLELAIALEAELPFAPNLDRENGAVTPAAARLLARQSKLSIHSRIQLMERAFVAGIVPVTELAELYQKMPLKPEAEAKALKEKQFPASAVEARALSFRLVQKDPKQQELLRARFPAALAGRIWPQAVELKALKPEQGLLVAVAHQALDWKVEEKLWQDYAALPETTAGANAAALELLSEAAASKRVGEVALRAMVLLPLAKNSVTLHALVSSLRAVGLETEAAALALALVQQ